jgi:ribokinase
MKEGFCVVGSVNMDVITRTPRFPLPGETLTGTSLSFMPGGKGGNQAVALARLGAPVEMIGAIGDDILGGRYGSVFAAEGVGIRGLAVLPRATTGTASIAVAETGENEIVIVPGANASVTPEFVKSNASLVESAGFLLVQLEIPLESVLEAARVANRAHTRVILDPAPAPRDPLPHELYSLVDVITPNETEAALLTGADTETEEGIKKAAQTLLARGVKTVVVKAGARGAYYAEGDSFARVPGFSVTAVDTVAAGDSFNAGLAFALSRGDSLPRAIRYANAVGAISTTREGAQGAMPTLAELMAFLSDPLYSP